MDAEIRRRLMALFVEEAREGLGRMAQAVEGLERDEPEANKTLGRIAHGLKGAASSVELSALAEEFHQLEGQLSLVATAAEPERPSAAAGVRTMVERLRDAVEQLALATDPAGTPSDETAAPVAAKPRADRLSIPVSLLDEALALASAIARGVGAGDDLDTAVNTTFASGLRSQAARLEALLSDARMVPVSEALEGLEREVMQLAARLGRSVRLELEGTEVRADRRSLESARTLLRHLVRNALDHGIETPEERARAGKPTQSVLSLRFGMLESRLVLTVEDDGRGFDLRAVRRRLSETLGDERVAAMSDRDVLGEFAASGGSTREETTDISGRGLGLSAVSAMARSAGGTLEVETRSGEGSAIRVELPLQLYTAEVLVVTAGALTLGLPIASVVQTLPLGANRELVQPGPFGPTVSVGERILPLYPLAATLGGHSRGGRFVVIVREGSHEAGFEVDELGATTRVVPQAAAPAVGPGALVSGVSLLPDGTHLSVLDAAKLLARVRSSTVVIPPPAQEPTTPVGTRERSRLPGTKATPLSQPGHVDRPLEVLLAEDSLSTREVLRVLLEEEGFSVRLAADGEEAWRRASERAPDVVVTDVNMPVRDGLWLTRKLRANPSTSQLPILLLTSQGDEHVRSAGADAGADAHLLKQSFNAGVLRETLRRLGVIRGAV